MDIPHAPRDLILLHGTYKCMLREAGGRHGPRHCHIGRCQNMRRLVTHMMSCPSDRKCSWPVSCSWLRQEIKHLVDCIDKACPICVRKKVWQMTMSAAQRSSVVDLLMQTTTSVNCHSPGNRPASLHDKVLCYTLIEDDIYRTADSLEDYYRMLAVKKWDREMVRKEIRTMRGRPMERLQRYRPYGPVNVREQPDQPGLN